jgi:hypothetical protein
MALMFSFVGQVAFNTALEGLRYEKLVRWKKSIIKVDFCHADRYNMTVQQFRICKQINTLLYGPTRAQRVSFVLLDVDETE